MFTNEFIEEVKPAKEEAKGPKPPRAISAYIFFSNEMVPKFKNEHGLSHRDAMKKAGETWKSMNESDKEKFNKMHEEDQKRYLQLMLKLYRYEKQLSDYEKKGYWVGADGMKSTDIDQIGVKKKSNAPAKKGEKRTTRTEKAKS